VGIHELIGNIDDETKKLFKILGIGIIVLIISFVLITLKKNFLDVNTEAKIEKKITSLTKNYYKSFIHDKFTLKELEARSSEGIEIDLYGLLYKLKYTDIDDFYLEKEDKRCNLNRTYIMVYPKSPYGDYDYEIKIKLDFSE